MGEKALTPLSTGPWGGASRSSRSPISPERRHSQARIVDQRLDPGVLWNPDIDNGSRASMRSLQDDQDYSRRVLRVSRDSMGESCTNGITDDV